MADGSETLAGGLAASPGAGLAVGHAADKAAPPASRRHIIFTLGEVETLCALINATAQERDALRHENEFLRAVLASLLPHWDRSPQ